MTILGHCWIVSGEDTYELYITKGKTNVSPKRHHDCSATKKSTIIVAYRRGTSYLLGIVDDD